MTEIDPVTKKVEQAEVKPEAPARDTSAFPVKALYSDLQSVSQKSGADSNPQAVAALPALTIEHPDSEAKGTAKGSGVDVSAAYVSMNSAVGHTAEATVVYKDVATLNLAAGADSTAGLRLTDNLGIMEASVKTGKWTIGAMPTTMGVEQTGPSNSFNTYSDIYNTLRNSAMGVKYSPDDHFTVGITNTGINGRGWVPNAVEVTYSAAITPELNLNAGADIGSKNSVVDANLTFARGPLTLSLDSLYKPSGPVTSVEGSYQLSKTLSLSGRIQSTGKKAIAVRANLTDELSLQAQQENKDTSFEAFWRMQVQS